MHVLPNKTEGDSVPVETGQPFGASLIALGAQADAALRSTLGLIKILQRELNGISGQASRCLSGITSGAEHVCETLEILNDLVLLETGSLTIEREPVDMYTFLHYVCSGCAQSVSRRGVGLYVNIRPQVGIVQGDESRLERVLTNLYHNVIMFTETGRTAGFEAERLGDKVCIRIWNEGSPLVDQLVEQLFLPPARAAYAPIPNTDMSRHDAGLILTREIVHRHGGKLSIGPFEKGINLLTITLPAEERRQ
ncbi:MAG: sensor histidine kinase [Spirochaetia bacterium]